MGEEPAIDPFILAIRCAQRDLIRRAGAFEMEKDDANHVRVRLRAQPAREEPRGRARPRAAAKRGETKEG